MPKRRKKKLKASDLAALAAATATSPQSAPQLRLPVTQMAGGMKCGGKVQKKKSGGRVHGCGMARRKR